MALILGTAGDDILSGTVIPGPGDSIDDIILGKDGNDTLTGLSGDDLLEGGAGDDLLQGSIGDDFLLGGDGLDQLQGNDGDDTLIGDKGNDNINGGAGDDVIIWTNGDGSDNINGGSADIEDRQEVNGALAVGDEFELFADLAGNALFSRLNLGLFTLTIDDVEKVRVFGHGGDDEFVVGDLSSTDVEIVNFFGGDGDDFLDASDATTRVTFSGDADDDFAIGGSGNDFLRGGDGIDLLAGGDGNDRLVGDKGADSLFGEGGNDFIFWDNGDGADTVDGGDGFDTQRFDMANGPSDTMELTSAGGDALFSRLNLIPFTVTLDNVERVVVQGRDGDDVFRVNNVEDASDVISVHFAGNLGDDTLLTTGGTTVDIVANGGTGNDLLHGGHGNDSLVGADGDDILIGHDGEDRLLGQEGNDILTGGGKRDVFVFESGDGDDIITDFQNNLDIIRFNGVAFDFGSLAIADSGIDLRIDTVDGDSITLSGRAGLALDAGDFLFA